MHGNVKYMHCSNENEEHSRQFYLAPTLSQVEDRTNHVPRCKICDEPMKPHAMFFDECYNEHYYRQRTIDDIEYDLMDCLIVVGTALATSGARSIVNRTLNKQNIPVIELNLEPQCKVSYTM
jgi:NAD-dependent SIR2 family protein deacetylase